MSPPGENDVRLRRTLEGVLEAPVWPAGYVMRTLFPGDERALHALLLEVGWEIAVDCDDGRTTFLITLPLHTMALPGS